MFIVSVRDGFWQLRRSAMLLRRIFAYHISLLWSSNPLVTFRIYKPLAPPELKRLVVVGE
jgi:hypothetical protein